MAWSNKDRQGLGYGAFWGKELEGFSVWWLEVRERLLNSGLSHY